MLTATIGQPYPSIRLVKFQGKSTLGFQGKTNHIASVETAEPINWPQTKLQTPQPRIARITVQKPFIKPLDSSGINRCLNARSFLNNTSLVFPKAFIINIKDNTRNIGTTSGSLKMDATKGAVA